MFRTRVLTAVVVLPLVFVAVGLGGLWLFALLTILLSLAAFEFCRLMEQDGFHPPLVFALGMVWVLLADAQFPDWGILGPGMSVVLMGSLVWQMAHREGSPVADWALGIVGALYIGWCGAHLLRLRALPNGVWWVFTALPAIWIADSGAYSIGRAWGRRKLAPTLSPGKTWEGYIGGVIVGAICTAGLAALWGLRDWPSTPSPLEGLALGVLVGTLAPLGDLAVSMMKRHVGMKDTGALFPGHGGALDRIDSVLWASVIGYYFVLWLHGS